MNAFAARCTIPLRWGRTVSGGASDAARRAASPCAMRSVSSTARRLPGRGLSDPRSGPSRPDSRPLALGYPPLSAGAADTVRPDSRRPSAGQPTLHRTFAGWNANVPYDRSDGFRSKYPETHWGAHEKRSISFRNWCARKAHSNAGASPAGAIRRFSTEDRANCVAARRGGEQAWSRTDRSQSR